MLLVLMVVIGIIANPNTVPQKIDGFEWLPINLYINGDTFYYILYGMLGRAIGMMDTQHKSTVVGERRAVCDGGFYYLSRDII